MNKSKAFAGLLSLLMLPVLHASVARAQEVNPGRPGTINYVEGSASIDNRAVTSDAIGSAALDAGQVLSTAEGKVEMLLTPGIFFRLDSNSAVKMVSPNLTKTVVELDHGRASIEVDQIYKQNNVQVLEKGKLTQLLKTGFYEFDADKGDVRVFEGKAAVQEQGDKWDAVKGHHELAFSDAAQLKAQGFDTGAAKDDLYNWSSLRSDYLAQANGQIAGEYSAPGWYWDPYFYGYTFLGASPFWSPFGWGFYGGGWYGPGGFYGRGYYGHGYQGRGYVGGGRGVEGGGFHGGGGGGVSHGGGGGGGHR